jgi:hypothetical protein
MILLLRKKLKFVRKINGQRNVPTDIFDDMI